MMAPGGLSFETISSDASLAALAAGWDDLVRAMPRPSPMLLHGWLTEWWRYYGEEGELAVQVAYRNGQLVGALPLCVRPKFGLGVLGFLGGNQSALADLLLADGESLSVGAALSERATSSGQDLADLFGLPADSRLAAVLGPSRLRLIERSEAPVLDLDAGWDAAYRAKTSSKRRNLHRRKRRQLGELGRLESVVARTAEELERALEDAFLLHALRWRGRPDGSQFATPTGMRFHRAAIQAVAAFDVARVVTLRLDGRPIAFLYYFALEGRMYFNRLAFDPEFGRFSPGLLNTFDALEAASAEGATRVEFLGGAERYKLELADRIEPLYQGFGLEGSLRGRTAVAARFNSIRLRRFLKRSPALRRFYFEGLAPARRLLRRGGPPARDAHRGRPA
jgi:CelD/BcsL family acetyltransferase involved in cellulose biosynthesis